MLRDRKYYLVNLANLSSVKDEDIGIVGVTLRNLLSQNINIPFGFILTTSSFDDFLVANDLVDFIGSRINEPDYNNFDQIKENSKQIQDAIMAGVMPDLIREPIEKAYQGLSGFAQANVSLRVSVNNQELVDSLKGSTQVYENVFGIDNLYTKIKSLWAEFFNPNAIFHRGTIGYEGFLTESIVVQRSMQAEVSGRLYSINPTDNDPDFIEIQAIWGMEIPEILTDVVPDSYFFSKQSSQLVEKKIISQEYMLVRKARYDEKEPFIKVQISKMWQKKQKLDNKYLIQLFHYALTLERVEKKPFELQWVLESGKICVTAMRDLDVPVPVEEKYPLKTEGFVSQDITDFDGASVLITPQKQMEEYVEEINSEIKEKEDTKKLDPDDVISESSAENGKILTEDDIVGVDEDTHIENIEITPVENVLLTEESLDFPQTNYERHVSSINELAKDLSGSPLVQEADVREPDVQEGHELDEKDTSGQSSDIPNKQEEKINKDVEVEEDPIEKVEVDIKPIKELKNITKGEVGLSKATSFGLLKLVKKSFDLEDLTGDEVLAFENITFKDIEFINHVRGALVQGQIYKELLSLIKVPIIYGNSKILENVLDNSVVTIDGETGKLYLGAGIKNEKQTEESKLEDFKTEVFDKENSSENLKNEERQDDQEVHEAHSEIFAPPSFKTDPSLIVKNESEEEVELRQRLEALRKIPYGNNNLPVQEKGYTITINDFKDNIPVNSVTEFWQVLNSKRINLDLKNAKGLFLPFDEIYKIIGVDLTEVLADPKIQKDFIKKCVIFVDDLVQRSGSVQLMLISASLDELNPLGLQSKVEELINVDLEILSILRNDYGYRNLWYGFNDINNAEELYEKKKNVTTEGMRRSVSFKLFAVLKKSYSLFGIKNIVDNNNIDGVIIDIDALMKDFTNGKSQLDDVVVNLLKFVLSFVNSNNKIVFFQNSNVSMLPAHIKQLLEAGLTHFATVPESLMNFKLNIVDQEVSRIERRKKRGRKKKVIDFGF